MFWEAAKVILSVYVTKLAASQLNGGIKMIILAQIFVLHESNTNTAFTNGSVPCIKQ
jgi:hypothetical protein